MILAVQVRPLALSLCGMHSAPLVDYSNASRGLRKNEKVILWALEGNTRQGVRNDCLLEHDYWLLKRSCPEALTFPEWQSPCCNSLRSSQGYDTQEDYSWWVIGHFQRGRGLSLGYGPTFQHSITSWHLLIKAHMHERMYLDNQINTALNWTLGHTLQLTVIADIVKHYWQEA